jgi:hypothetical protein
VNKEEGHLTHLPNNIENFAKFQARRADSGKFVIRASFEGTCCVDIAILTHYKPHKCISEGDRTLIFVVFTGKS